MCRRRGITWVSLGTNGGQREGKLTISTRIQFQ